MYEWWKAPVLQGEENDYGDYDYLIEEIPRNHSEWHFDRDGIKINGKISHIYKAYEEYFRTLDGYDSFTSYSSLSDEIHSIIYNFYSKFKIYKYYKRYKYCKRRNLKAIEYIFCDWFWVNTSWR